MIAENVANIRRRIAAACKKAGRNPEEITLIAITKTFGIDDIREVLRAGVRDVGENYVQELLRKRNALGDEDIRWHFVGHLQTNKARQIAAWIHAVHSVDSVRCARELSVQAGKAGRQVNVLVEVNTTGEKSKYGIVPGEAAGIAREISLLPHLNFIGLMTIGPLLPDPESSRPAFRMLADLRASLEKDGIRVPQCSMGMTNDFEAAIEEGATMVRIGTAIFGKRTRPGGITS